MMDIKPARRLAGHADIGMTRPVYTHLTKFKEGEAINSLNAHLGKAAVFEPERMESEHPKQKKMKICLRLDIAPPDYDGETESG